jgi:hypothetical protein
MSTIYYEKPINNLNSSSRMDLALLDGFVLEIIKLDYLDLQIKKKA